MSKRVIVIVVIFAVVLAWLVWFYFGERPLLQSVPLIVDTVIPNTVSINDPTTPITVDGSGFTDFSIITIGGIEIPTTFDAAAQQLTGVVPDICGTYGCFTAVSSLVVTDTGVTSNSLPFTFEAPNPSMNSLTGFPTSTSTPTTIWNTVDSTVTANGLNFL